METKYCRNCGAPVDSGARVCSNCGGRIDDLSVATKEESSTLGILALVFGILGGWLGLILGIIGLCTYKDKNNRKNCKIGLGFFIAETLLLIILMLVIML